MKQFFTHDPLDDSNQLQQEKVSQVRKLDRDSEEYQFFNEVDNEIKKLNMSQVNEGVVRDLYEKYTQILLKKNYQSCYYYNVINKSQISEQLKISCVQSLKVYYVSLRQLLQRSIDNRNSLDLEKTLKLVLLVKLDNFQQNWNFSDQILETLARYLSLQPIQNKSQVDVIQIYTPLNLRLSLQVIEQLLIKIQSTDKIQSQIISLYDTISTFAHNLVLDLNNQPKLIENQNYLRLLSQILSLIHILDKITKNFAEYSTSKISKLTEQHTLKFQKFLYLGLPIYHHKIFGKEQKDLTISNQIFSLQSQEVTSTSEQSENDENMIQNREKSKQESLFRKIRCQTTQLLREVLSNNRQLIQQYWENFLKFNNITKTFVKEYGGFKELNVLRQKSVRNYSYEQIRLIEANYLDPSLMGALLLESEEKNKQELISLSDVIIESVDAKNWMKGLEAEKVEKQNNNVLSKSYQIYLALKNVHHTLMFYLQSEDSYLGVISGFRLLSSLITKTGLFQKLKEEEGILVYTEKIVLPLFWSILEAEKELGQVEGGRVRGLNLLQMMHEGLGCLNSMLTPELNASLFLQQFCRVQELTALNQEPVPHQQNLILSVAYVLNGQLRQSGNNAQLENLQQALAVEGLNFFIRLAAVCKAVFYECEMSLWRFLHDLYQRTSKGNLRIILAFLRLFEQLNHSVQASSANEEESFPSNGPSEKSPEKKKTTSESQKSLEQFSVEFEVRFLPTVFRDLLESRLREETSETQRDFLLIFFSLLQNLRDSNLEETLLEKIANFMLRFEPGRQAPALRQQFYQALSHLCRLPYFSREQQSALRLFAILEKGITENQGKAILQQKVLQGLSNWVETVPNFFGKADELFEICTRTLESKNEKLQSAGIRCLGLIYQKLKIPDSRLNTLKQIYVTHFQSRSVKVCWNTCVSLRMALRNTDNARLVDEKTLDGLIAILEGRENFKTQIQSLQTLQALENRLLRSRLTEILASTKNLIHDNDNPYSFVEFKYYDTLQELSVGLFVRCLSTVELSDKTHEKFVKTMVKEDLSLMLDILQKYLYIQWRKTREDVILAFNEKEKLIQEQGFIQNEKIKEKIFNLKKKIQDFEQDLELKNDESMVLNFNLQKLNPTQKQTLISDLLQVKSISKVVSQIIDTQEDVQVSFVLYDQFQKYRDLLLDHQQVISIPVIQY